jgi:phospholipase/lecithinase/hemolysin
MVHRFIAAAALVLATPAASFTPSKFVVFGDSFVDAGSVNQFSGGTLAPSALGFWYGRWSDGPSWVDYLGYANFGAPTKTFYTGNAPGTIPGSPGFTYTPGASNFAVGGARAGSNDGLIPSLPTQVGLYNQYLLATGDLPDANTLFILNFGNNDVNYINSLAGDPVAQVAAFDAYVNNMAAVTLGLAMNGAQHILVAGVPNPTKAPGPALQAALDLALNAVETNPMFGTASLYRFDYFAFFNALEADPTQFGLPATLITDQSRNCLAEVPPLGDCSNYLLFDGTHVTRGVQQAISIQVGRQLGIAVVPEAGTWAMLIAGFGLVGTAARRRRAQAAA